MTNAQDAHLIARIQSGDVEAFAPLIAPRREAAMRCARRMLKNRIQAEEACQDAFVRAFQSIVKGTVPQQFDKWFFTILLNRCRVYRQRMSRQLARFGPGNLMAAFERANPVLPDEASLAWRDEIDQALERLERREREAFLLKHVEGLQYNEMSKLTGVTVSALKMRVLRARTLLQVLLREADAAA